jgi:hypothetical protein
LIKRYHLNFSSLGTEKLALENSDITRKIIIKSINKLISVDTDNSAEVEDRDRPLIIFYPANFTIK